MLMQYFKIGIIVTFLILMVSLTEAFVDCFYSIGFTNK